MRRRPALLLAPVALVGGLAAVPTAQAAPVATLAHETVIEGDHPAMIRVSVPTAALISFDVKRSVELEGSGRYVGIRLVEEHSSPSELDVVRGPQQAGGRVELHGDPASTRQTGNCYSDPLPVSTPGQQPCSTSSSDLARVRRGVYRLYLLTDGAPVRVTLRFANLEGSTLIRPTERIPFAIRSITPGPTVPGVPSVAAGDTHEMPGRSNALLIGWWDQDEQHAYARTDFCVNGEPTDYEWLPGCPTGSSVGTGSVRTPLSPSTSWMAFDPGHYSTAALVTDIGPHDSVAIGFSRTAEGVRGIGGIVVWMPAGPPAALQG